MQRVPLAERMRPTKLDDVIGQVHLLGDGEILRQIVARKEPVSLILWGPPGSGKTTLARIIASKIAEGWNTVTVYNHAPESMKVVSVELAVQL